MAQHLLKADKELILEVNMEEKEAKADTEQRKLNVHNLPESKQGTLEKRSRDYSEIDLSMFTDRLNLDVEIENMFHLGAVS